MGKVTTSSQNNITSPNGNSLAVFVEGTTGVMKVKDVMGNIQPLSDFTGCLSPFKYDINGTGIEPILGTNNASGDFATIGGGFYNKIFPSQNYNNNYPKIGDVINGGNCNTINTNTYLVYGATGGNTIGGGFCNTANPYIGFVTIGGGQGNIASCSFSTIGGGFCNTASNYFSTVGGGLSNVTSAKYSTINGGYNNTASNYGATVGGGTNNIASELNSTVGGGCGNTASGTSSTIGGGSCNTASGNYSAILGGASNTTNSCACAFIVGNNITADRVCTTFVNNLSIKNIPTASAGLPSGSVWRNGTVLEIVS